jgi:hypothetical protein
MEPKEFSRTFTVDVWTGARFAVKYFSGFEFFLLSNRIHAHPTSGYPSPKGDDVVYHWAFR